MGGEITLKNRDFTSDEIFYDWSSDLVETDSTFTHNKEKDILCLHTVSRVLPGTGSEVGPMRRLSGTRIGIYGPVHVPD